MKEHLRCTACGRLFPATGNETVWLSSDGRLVLLSKYTCEECKRPCQNADAADTPDAGDRLLFGA